MNLRSSVRYGLILVLGLVNLGFVQPGRAAPAATGPSQGPSAILIADNEFQPGDWSASAEIIGSGTYTVAQQLTGGYGGGEFRFMSHTLPPVTSGISVIYVTHIYTAYTFDPAVQGAIDHIDYSESGILLSFPFSDTLSTTQPVIVQDGNVYRSPRFIRFTAQNFAHNWETKSLPQLTAADFFVPGGPENDNPDFSASGSPMQFGFARNNSRSTTQPPVPPGQDLVIDQGVDNWRLFIHLEPEVDPPNQPPQAVDDVFILDGYQHGLPLYAFFDVVDNDTDPDLDSLEVITATQSTYGSTGLFSWHSVFYRLEEAQVHDVFEYTLSDGEFASTAQVDVYIDCACTVLCLNYLTPPDPPSLAGVQAVDAIDLPLIYRVRDHILKPTPHGQRYVAMYYEQNPEILVNLMLNAPLRAEAVATVELWQPNLASLVDGDGSAIITQAQVDAIASFLSNLSAVSSPALQQLIAAELLRLGPLDGYVGLTMSAAKQQAIGDATLYLPVTVAP